MTFKRRRSLFIQSCALAVVLGVPVLSLVHISRQQALNSRLIAAIKRNDEPTVRLLLAQGADANALDLPPSTHSLWNEITEHFSRHPRYIESAEPALMIALEVGINDDAVPDNAGVIEDLIGNGARIDIRTRSGYTPLKIASDAGKLNCARLLLDHGAHVDEGYMRFTPLMGAVIWGRDSVCKLLLERGANVNAQDNEGETVLMHAIRGQHINAVRLLLHWHARVDSSVLIIAQQKLPDYIPLLKQAARNQ